MTEVDWSKEPRGALERRLRSYVTYLGDFEQVVNDVDGLLDFEKHIEWYTEHHVNPAIEAQGDDPKRYHLHFIERTKYLVMSGLMALYWRPFSGNKELDRIERDDERFTISDPDLQTVHTWIGRLRNQTVSHSDPAQREILIRGEGKPHVQTADLVLSLSFLPKIRALCLHFLERLEQDTKAIYCELHGQDMPRPTRFRKVVNEITRADDGSYILGMGMDFMHESFFGGENDSGPSVDLLSPGELKPT